MDVNKYLQRIHSDEIKNNDLATLKILQNNHMLNVPFENLDVINKVPIPLNIKSYYEKIVNHNRGGFCYELNGLFNWLLTELGYKTTLVAASVRRPDGSWSVMDTTHACLLVHFDVPYLVDVGFGDSARVPIPLTGEIKSDVSGSYRMKKLADNTYDLQRKQDEWTTLIRVNITSRQLNDFEEACHFNQTSSGSVFTQKEIISLATKDGRITYSDEQLTITNEAGREEIDVKLNEKKAIIQTYFDMSID